jgi:hypothetical protein
MRKLAEAADLCLQLAELSAPDHPRFSSLLTTIISTRSEWFLPSQAIASES